MTEAPPPPPPAGERRVIKRYSNRKLYDTRESRYVTLLQIAEMIRAGEDVQIVDNATKEDKTDITLALIISEELKARPATIPLSSLRLLIRHGGERLMSQLREGPFLGRFMSREAAEPMREAAEPPAEPTRDAPEAPLGADAPAGAPPVAAASPSADAPARDARETRGLLATFTSWQTFIDERVRSVLPDLSPVRDLREEVAQLRAEVARLRQLIERPSGSLEH